MVYIYINSQFKNNSQNLASATSNEQRGDNIIPQNNLFEISVDRWFISGAYLPLFKVPNESLYIKIGSSSENIIFTTQDNNGFIYCMDDIITAINECFIKLLTNLNIPLNSIEITFDYTKYLFSITTTQDFLNLHSSIIFSNKLGIYLSGFQNQKLINNEWILTLKLLNIQMNTTIDLLSPVLRISIESSDIPSIPELLPDNNNSFSRNISNIISDYKFYQSDLSIIKNIVYNADGNHRWNSIINGMSNFKNMSISYFWFDYDNNKYQFQIINGGVVEAKLVFKTVNMI